MTKEKSALVQEKLEAQALLEELRSSKKEVETQVGDKTSDDGDPSFEAFEDGLRTRLLSLVTELVPSHRSLKK